LGIVPAIAYNLIIPTIFSLIALGAFSIGWNLIGYSSNGAQDQRSGIKSLKTIVGLAAALGMAVLGNLGIVRMIFQGYQRLAAPDGNIEAASILTRWIWAAEGAVKSFLGTSLPYGIADWYWNPSRVIPAPNEVEPITEFPFFTVLYGDPHAHLFAMPIALLALSWGLSVLFNRAWRGETGKISRLTYSQIGVGFVLGGLAIGALWPTNTWDLPVYLGLGLLALGYAVWINHHPGEVKSGIFSGISVNIRKTMLLIGGLVLLVGLAFLFYRPYAQWYVQGYTSIELWKGTKTPIWSYLTHWGLFLFLIISWMVWETRDWMARTPLSSIKKLDPYRELIGVGLILLLGGVVILLFIKVAIAWFVLPLAAWAVIMQFRPRTPLPKRAVLLMVAGGLLLTLMVEVIVLKGDIARMNTVFKFYLQVWTLFSVSAAAALGWLLLAQSEWSPSWRSTWQIALFMLVASTALYPMLGGIAKIKDRMVPEAPHTLDGMAFMQGATYDDLNTIMDLNQDYQAIRWLQENVRESPVIVEGNMVEYHWGNRNTIYTGLPNVIGWNWHQRQQRATGPENLISNRITAVNEFYLTTDTDQARSFLDRYQVKYVILGQLERALYPGPGLDKFEELDGSLWREVFRVGETTIYEVLSG
jgi:YYY domain-containing protein